MKVQYDHMPPRIEAVGNGSYFFRWNIEQVTIEGDNIYTCKEIIIWNYPKREQIIEGIIRSRYSASEVEAIVNNYLQQKNIIEHLKLQNFRAYAKAIADEDAATASALQQKQTYKITLPFSETLSGGTYEALSDRMLKVKIDFASDAINNTAIAYPAFILPEDLQVLQADPNVTIEQIDLFIDD